MSGDGDKSRDLKLSSLSRFSLRGRGRGSSPNLPSHKPTLGAGTPKRTFSPNIVSRSMKKEETADKQHPQFKDKRGRGRGRGGRGRGRGRGDNIIQSSGVFSHGIFAQQTLAKALSGGGGYGGGVGGSGGGGSSTAKVSFKEKKEEMEEDNIQSDKILEMMEDEGKIELDEKGFMMPITLPLASKLTHKIKQDDIKTESESSQDEGDYKYKFKIKKPIIKEETNTPRSVEMAHLFRPDAPDGQLFFFQLPDTLPIKPISEDEPIKKEKDEEVKQIPKKEDITEEDLGEHLKRFTFRNVSEGFIGKLRVHKSGKVKMHLGNVSLDLTLGTPCGFLQDLISVQTDREPAEMISLGHVNHRIIGIPDYKALLGSVAM